MAPRKEAAGLLLMLRCWEPFCPHLHLLSWVCQGRNLFKLGYVLRLDPEEDIGREKYDRDLLVISTDTFEWENTYSNTETSSSLWPSGLCCLLESGEVGLTRAFVQNPAAGGSSDALTISRIYTDVQLSPMLSWRRRKKWRPQPIFRHSLSFIKVWNTETERGGTSGAPPPQKLGSFPSSEEMYIQISSSME